MCLPALPILGALGAGGAAMASGAGLMTVMQAGALGLSAVSSIAGGYQNAAIGRQNAAMAAQDAAQARLVGQIEEERRRDDMMRGMAVQRSQIAASGASLASGTSLDLGRDAAETGALDAQAIRYGATSRAAALDRDSQMYLLQSRQERMRGFYSAAGSLLTAPPTLWQGLRGAR